MLEVAIGWEVYDQHRSALDLGWIGLAEFVPLFVLALPAGQLADRVSRRLIFAGSLLLGAGVGVGLALISGAGVTSILLGAILLDLLAVLFGGAVGLMPIFARSILHVGATGLGILRAPPAVGALVGAAVITRRPIGGRAGRRLFTVVLLYGACIVVFGVSRFYPLSLAALAVSGFVDLYSVNIRSTTVALASPNRLRGGSTPSRWCSSAPPTSWATSSPAWRRRSSGRSPRSSAAG